MGSQGGLPQGALWADWPWAMGRWALWADWPFGPGPMGPGTRNEYDVNGLAKTKKVKKLKNDLQDHMREYKAKQE